MRKVILASSYEKYIQCCHRNCLNPKEVPFVRTPEDLPRGSGGINPIFFGDYWLNPRYPEIERAMRARGIAVGGKYMKRTLERIDLDK